MLDSFELFYARFVIDNRAYLEQQPDGSYLGRYAEVTIDLIRQHLAGKITIAMPAACLHGYSIWVCFDDDSGLPESQAGALDNITQYLGQHSYYYIREGKRPLANSLFKQGHVWVLIDHPIRKEYARGWGLQVMKQCGIDSSVSIELFPKDGIVKNYAAGVRLPLGCHAKAGGQRIWLPGLPEDLEVQLDWLVSQPLNDSKRIEFLGRKQHELYEVERHYSSNFKREPRSINSGPSVLRMLHELNWDLSRQGKYYIGRCPICAEEGHDKSHNNLHVATDGTWFGCYYQGWNIEHKSKQIYKALLIRTGRA